MGEVDLAFIQDPDHRPKLSITEAEGIPLIDLSPIISTPNSISDPIAIEGVVREIGNACRDWGFFQVINHGVSLDKLLKIEAVARKFFALPLEEKRKIMRDEKNILGYYDSERNKNVRDWKELFDFTVKEPTFVPSSPDPEDKEVIEWYNQWPAYLPELSYFKEQTSFIRLNHYPPCPSPELTLGVGRHKDGGALTVLAQDDVGGLEVKRKTDGEWIWVKPTPNAYVINVGDKKERFSMPFFLNPAHYTIIKPLEELTNEENPAKYKPYSWGKFFAHRQLSNYKKLNVENIQIHHFRVSE
ncbi:unnamed protein product [Prunus brigantina]